MANKNKIGPKIVISVRDGKPKEVAPEAEAFDEEAKRQQRMRKRKQVLAEKLDYFLNKSPLNQRATMILQMINNKRLRQIPLTQEEIELEAEAMRRFDKIAAIQEKIREMKVAIDSGKVVHPERGSIEGVGDWSEFETED